MYRALIKVNHTLLSMIQSGYMNFIKILLHGIDTLYVYMHFYHFIQIIMIFT